MVDIIILNPIDSFNDDFNSTFFVEAHFLPQNSPNGQCPIKHSCKSH
jgi:hypothetical protein